MVFGWGKKKEKKPESPMRQEISLSEIPQTVERLTNLRKEQLISEISSLREATNPLIKKLNRIIQQLESDNLKTDDIDKHLRVIVVRGKKQVIEIIKKEATELPSISSYEDAVQDTTKLGQLLKRIGDVLGRQTRVIHIFAKKYAEKLKQLLEEMNQNCKEMQDLLKNFENTNDLSHSILQTFTQIQEKEKSLLENQTKYNEIEKSLSQINLNIESTTKAIDEIKTSVQYKDYTKLKEQLENILSQKRSLKDEVGSQFTKISRPLGRYEYVSSLEKEQKNLLTQLIENPTNVLNKENKDSIILILENVRKGISSGSISVKDQDKTMSHLTDIEEMLDGMISKIHQNNQSILQINEKIKTTKPKELSSLESSLEELFKNKEDLESKLKMIREEIDDTSNDIPKLLAQIEDDLKKFSKTRYTIRKEN